MFANIEALVRSSHDATFLLGSLRDAHKGASVLEQCVLDPLIAKACEIEWVLNRLASAISDEAGEVK